MRLRILAYLSLKLNLRGGLSQHLNFFQTCKHESNNQFARLVFWEKNSVMQLIASSLFSRVLKAIHYTGAEKNSIVTGRTEEDMLTWISAFPQNQMGLI